MTTGQRIKAARKKAGMTQKELGQKLGISFQGVAQWENDLRNPKIETLEKITKILGCSLVDLTGNSDEGHKIKRELVLNNDLSGLDTYFGRTPGTFEDIIKDGERIVERKDGSIVKYTEYRFKIKGYDGNAYFQDFEEVQPSPYTKISELLSKLNRTGQQKAIERIEELTEIAKYQVKLDTEKVPPKRD